MTVKELIKILRQAKPEAEVMIDVWHDRNSGDPNDTDMSGFEPEDLLEKNIIIEDNRHNKRMGLVVYIKHKSPYDY